MPNQWGTSQPTEQFYYMGLIGAADVVCPAGVETNIAQATGAAGWGPGSFVPALMGSALISLGATPPTNMILSLRVNNGADQANVLVYPGLLVANANLWIPIFMYGSGASPTLWYPNGQNLQLSCTPTGGAVTARNNGSTVYYSVVRVQDGS